MSKVPLYVHGGAERMRGGARQLALCSTSRGSVSATETKRERERERETDRHRDREQRREEYSG